MRENDNPYAVFMYSHIHPTTTSIVNHLRIYGCVRTSDTLLTENECNFRHAFSFSYRVLVIVT